MFMLCAIRYINTFIVAMYGVMNHSLVKLNLVAFMQNLIKNIYIK